MGEKEEYLAEAEELYRKGEYREALPLYRELTKGKDAVSLYRLAYCLNEVGNADEAFAYFMESALLGYAKAEHAVGQCYFRGIGVKKDKAEALKWFEKAAEQGHIHSQFMAGSIHYFPVFEGLTDHEKAAKYFRMAAEQGDGQSCNSLGVCYENGYGVEKSLEEAAKWFKQGAEHGASDAQTNYGLCLLEGKGVSQNQAEAIKWLTLAAKQGNEKADNVLKRLLDEA